MDQPAPLADPNPEDERAMGELVRRATAGDREAVEGLLTAHLSRLRAFLRLRMGGAVRARESTEDLVQSVCREALERLDGFEYRGEASFRHWLFQQAEHKVIDRARFYGRAKREGAREVSIDRRRAEDETLRGLESLFTPSRDAVAREEVERLEAAFAKLPPDQREVILLARIVGLPHAEIAERMGRSVSATWTLLSRALARLSTHLSP
jgi:RNA polymerase sigma-70 factor, ECF subfamily